MTIYQIIETLLAGFVFGVVFWSVIYAVDRIEDLEAELKENRKS